jgi:hypothetical protein
MPIRIAIYTLLGGAFMILAGVNQKAPASWYVAGILIAAAFVPYLLHGPKANWKRLAAIWCALFSVSSLCTFSEALIFAPKAVPQPVPMLIGSIVMYSILAGLLALIARVTKVAPMTPVEPAYPATFKRVALTLVGGGFVYVVYYYVFGAIVFQLMTKPYYTGNGLLADAAAAVLKLGWWFPLIQICRGMLMTLGLLPVILGTRMNKLPLAIYAGLLVWTIGGLALLIPPSPFMPVELRWMHIFEIFTQNFSLGFTVVYLLRGRQTQPALSHAPVGAAA